MNIHVLVCPHCNQLNHLSQTDFENHPLCNCCGEDLILGIAIDVDEIIFKHFINYSSLPVVVEFWGAWSGISHEMATVFNALADTFKQDAIFLRVNSEQQQVLANSYKLIDIPTFILFTGGTEYHRKHGAISETEFHLWLERYLRVKRKKINHLPPSI